MAAPHNRTESRPSRTNLRRPGRVWRSVQGLWTKLIVDESGQSLIEYALVAALIALGAVVALKGLSGKISGTYDSVGSSLTSAI